MSSVESVTFSGHEDGCANCAADMSRPWIWTSVLGYNGREQARSIGQTLGMLSAITTRSGRLYEGVVSMVFFVSWEMSRQRKQ